MKFSAFFFALLFLSVSFAPPAEKKFLVNVEQDGKLVPIVDGVCTLKKKPFTLVFWFSEPMGVLVNASFSDSSYNAAKNERPLFAIPGFEETGMAEELHNAERQLIIAQTAPGYWYYDNEKEHRFNETKVDAGGITAKREIRQTRELEKKPVRIEKINAPLYLTFLSYEWLQPTYERRELQRAWIKLDWK